jgi:hypothetical protein
MNMKKLLCALAISALAAPGFAFADGGTSCATAQEIFSGATYTGDTSTSSSFIGAFGGLPSPGPDLAFKFTAHNTQNAINVTITGGWNAGAVITAACAGNAGNPIQAGAGTASFAVPVTGLTNDQLYYFYITGNPNDNSGPSGAFSFTTPDPALPVTLKDFSID